MRMGDELDVNGRCITDEIRVCAPLLHNLHFSRVGVQREHGTLSLNCYFCAAGSGRRSADMAHTPRLARVCLPRRRRHDVAAVARELCAETAKGKAIQIEPQRRREGRGKANTDLPQRHRGHREKKEGFGMEAPERSAVSIDLF